MERRRCLRWLPRDSGVHSAGRHGYSPIAKSFRPEAGACDPVSRTQMLIDGLHEAAAALDNLAEGRAAPYPIGMAVHTPGLEGLWFEQMPELDILFEALSTLEKLATAGTVIEVGNPIRQRARQLAKSLRALAGDARIGAPDETRAS